MANCDKRLKTCRKPECAHRYTKEERDLWACPECGDDRHCIAPSMPNGACWVHGGASPSGVDSATFVHGRYSQDAPTGIAKRASAALANPDLLSLRDDAAVAEAMIADALARMDSGESDSGWRKVGGLARQALKKTRRVVSAINRQDFERVADAVDDLNETLLEMSDVVFGGEALAQARTDVRTWQDHKRKLSNDERRLLVDFGVMMTEMQAQVLAARLMQIIIDHVPDERVVYAIAADLRQTVEE